MPDGIKKTASKMLAVETGGNVPITAIIQAFLKKIENFRKIFEKMPKNQKCLYNSP